MKKQITCTVCGGRGFVSWINSTGDTCSTGSKTCPHCNGTGLREVDATNADHIRSMTDEELADYMSEHSIDDFCYIICGGECKAVATFNKTPFQRCREIVSDWLKQPYKEDT